MKPAEEKQRFALRKLSIGTVSVLVGFLAFGFSASDQVKAATGDDASQNQAVTQVSQQPSQKAAESEIQSSDSTQQSAPAKQQATNTPQQQQSTQQPAVTAKEPVSKPVSADPVTETKTITRTIYEIRFTVNWQDPNNAHTIETIYTANYKRTKTIGADGQPVYSEWVPNGSHVAVYDVDTQQQLSESTNMLDIQNGQYVFPAYVLRGTPSDLLKPGSGDYKPIINYTTGKNADGSYKWVENQALTTPDVAGGVVNPNTSVDSKVEIEYLSGFNADSDWIYNRNIYDLDPTTGKFDYVEQGTNVMTHVWQEDPRQGQAGQYSFTGDTVPAYIPKHADQYIPYILVYKNNSWQPITEKSLPTKSFTNYDEDILPQVNNFKNGSMANSWTETYEIVYIKKDPETLNKPVKETIHYIFDNGSQAHEDAVQNVNLSKKVKVYAYNNTPVENPDTIPWSTSHFDAVQSPSIKGYTPDVSEIAAQNVDGKSNDLVFTVTYKKNAPKQVTDTKTITETIHYVYANGSQAEPDVVKTVNITRQGEQDAATDHITWQDWETNTIDAVTSPTIKGYTPDIATVGAFNVDGNSKDRVITVVYKKNDPTNVNDTKKVTETIHYQYTDGTQAAKDFQQTVNLTRQGKKDAATGEVTWDDWNTATIPAVVSPSIKGYTPNIATVDAFKIDGNSKDQVVTVVYKKNDPKNVSDSKKVTETIHYVYSDGTKASDDVVKTVTLKRNGTQDPVTDAIAWDAWNTAEIPAVESPVIAGYTADKLSVAAVSVDGTTPAELSATVTYTKNNNPNQPTEPNNPTQPTQPNPTQPTEPNNPTQPTQPNPTQPTEPNNPTQPTQPNPSQPTEPNNPTQPTQPKGQTSETPKNPDQPTEPTQPTQPKGDNNEPTPVVPQNPDNPVTPVTPATPTKPAQPVAENVQLEPQQPKPQANKLPQTGNDSNAMSIVGIAIASALAMLGISDKRQHN